MHANGSESETAQGSTSRDLYCSAVTRSTRMNPIGTAGSYQGYLLVEWPLPWPKDLSMVPVLEPIMKQAASHGLRFQGLVANRDDPQQHVIIYRRGEGDPHGLLVRQELIVDASEVVTAANSLLESPAPATPPSGVRREIDVLVCTHGRRDRCCGSLGTTLALALSASSERFGDGVRIWRTSHTGGHRFAPTALVLPEATLWGFLDIATLSTVIERVDPVEDVLDHYRGCALLGSPELQTLEREVLRKVGWELLDRPRWGWPATDGTFALEVGSPTGVSETWTGEVRVSRTLPVPDCGKPIEEAKKFDREFVCSTVGPDSAADPGGPPRVGTAPRW
jgi:hypothetical protein